MFTENDLLSYFSQMQKIEKEMCGTYSYLYERLTHPEYKEIFGQLIREEKAHDRLIEELKTLLTDT